MSWTDERVTLLRKLWCEGKTAAEIAKALGGVTRNAVIGKAHRLKLSNRISPIQQNTKKPVKSPEEKQKTRIAVAAPRPQINIKGIKFDQLKERMCRWPVGDPQEEDFKFCGCESTPGMPYCDGHAKMAYQAARARTLKATDLEKVNTSAAFDDAEEAKEVVTR